MFQSVTFWNWNGLRMEIHFHFEYTQGDNLPHILWSQRCLTSNNLIDVHLLSPVRVRFPAQHVERWSCQPKYWKRLLSTWDICCEEQPLSHQKPSSCPERQWGCRGHFSRTETCQLKIYSGGVMENALIQFMLINLKQWLKKRGKNRGESGTGCTHAQMQFAIRHRICVGKINYELWPPCVWRPCVRHRGERERLA